MSVSDELKTDVADDLLTAEIHPEALFPPRYYGWTIFWIFFLIGEVLGAAYIIQQEILAEDARIAIVVLVLVVSALCSFFAWAGAHAVVRYHTVISVDGDELIVSRKARAPIKWSLSDALLRPRGYDVNSMGFKELYLRIPLADCEYFIGPSYHDPQFYQFRQKWCLMVSWAPYDRHDFVAVAFSNDDIDHWLRRLEQSPANRTPDRNYWEREIKAVGVLGGATLGFAGVMVVMQLLAVLFPQAGLRPGHGMFPAFLVSIWSGQCGRLAAQSMLGFEVCRLGFKRHVEKLLVASCLLAALSIPAIGGNAKNPGTVWPTITILIVTPCGLATVYGVYRWAERREKLPSAES